MKWVLIITSIIGFSYFGFGIHENLNGVCADVGRPLTIAEKKEKLRQYYNIDYSLGDIKKYEGDFKKQKSLLHVFEWHYERGNARHTNKSKKYVRIDTHNKDVKLVQFESVNDDYFKVYIYPDVPHYAKRNPNATPDIVKRMRFGNYSRYIYGTYWAPVPFRYKLTGYAYDLALIDMTMRIKMADGQEHQTWVDNRNWMNACGDVVNIPESFHIG